MYSLAHGLSDAFPTNLLPQLTALETLHEQHVGFHEGGSTMSRSIFLGLELGVVVPHRLPESFHVHFDRT